MSLPRVYASPIDKDLNNYQKLYKSNDIRSYNPKEINKKINEIFGSSNHIYKSRVKITLKDDLTYEDIIGKTNTSLLTLSGKSIKITDILDIEKVY